MSSLGKKCNLFPNKCKASAFTRLGIQGTLLKSKWQHTRNWDSSLLVADEQTIGAVKGRSHVRIAIPVSGHCSLTRLNNSVAGYQGLTLLRCWLEKAIRDNSNPFANAGSLSVAPYPQPSLVGTVQGARFKFRIGFAMGGSQEVARIH